MNWRRRGKERRIWRGQELDKADGDGQQEHEVHGGNVEAVP